MTPLCLAFVAFAGTAWVLAKAISPKAGTHFITIHATACIGESCGLRPNLFLRSGPPG